MVGTWEQAPPPELGRPDTWPGKGQQKDKSMTKQKKITSKQSCGSVFTRLPRVTDGLASVTEFIITGTFVYIRKQK